MANEETGSPALAQMIHQTQLFTWLVRTAGNVLAVLVLTPVALGIVGGIIDADGGGAAAGAGLGVVLSIIILLVWLPRTTAPFPSDAVLDLLDANDEPPSPGSASLKNLGPDR
ncbi:hypothetical protein ACFQ0K_13990 [Nocardioides caeni]|uniref:Uncharacterized protein n=1 Tax=Nocardioides caeni TaxID=574700 RepID=A0A4S8N3D9_9ACTN|nr:hypothetical protein [Nocardioides caeni]THV09234.1 hypothetical protein E9934_16825 [Nocardioides caeni]